MKAQTLSLVIPVFNEEDHIADCLEAIANQSVMPDEVIVVDNNCTDKTIDIARKFSFVTVVKESEQGRAQARNKGFNTSKSEIIGRIDADARIAPDWVARLKSDFEDPTVMLVAGTAKSLFIPFSKIHSTIWADMYLLWARMIFGVTMLWGTNMAVRRKAWLAVADETSLNNYYHEDQDISVSLAKHHLEGITDKKLIVYSENKDKNVFPKYWGYVVRMYKTKWYHQQLGSFKSTRPMYNPLQKLSFWIMIFIPLKTLYLLSMVFTTTAWLLTKKSN